MNFSNALEYAKNGRKITRTSWNGKNQYVVLQKGYPDGIPINGNTSEATGIPVGTVCVFRPYLMIKTVNDEFVPWVANQSDLLCDDWTITE